ncbi:hypothetical protein FBY21_5721 [Pseudomonas sp. SLBN-26]|uniref:hypothetical protein n=1 Tax=Pseudomonadaceae TaxID=135621 RepID=UPI00114F24F6|nr:MULTISPECIES: hypothetical protein [Pseudomonas]MCP1621066.1 hypothetical protein [Pseudomonas otitidis]TQL10270.1 hypothetical protein FBY21_5721 [Pseudomonas sp. SLBN-26]
MTSTAAGSQTKRLFSRDDYLAPPAIPTGQPPKDVLNTIWRKNEVFLDITDYTPGSAVMVIWPMILASFWMCLPADGDGLDPLLATVCGIIVGIPTLIVLYGLTQPAPLPTRFNRQRREVCVPQADGTYWVVPWESVEAQAVAVDTYGQHGKMTHGLLTIGFRNPDPDAPEVERDYSIGFNCGGGTTAMCLWECIRSYMEVGPEVVPDRLSRFENKRGIIASYVFDVIEVGKTKGWVRALLWDGLCGLFLFNVLLIYAIERKKLTPPPDFTDPAIVEWSQPLPPEQWTKRSPELEAAIQAREAELAEQMEAKQV